MVAFLATYDHNLTLEEFCGAVRGFAGVNGVVNPSVAVFGEKSNPVSYLFSTNPFVRLAGVKNADHIPLGGLTESIWRGSYGVHYYCDDSNSVTYDKGQPATLMVRSSFDPEVLSDIFKNYLVV